MTKKLKYLFFRTLKIKLPGFLTTSFFVVSFCFPNCFENISSQNKQAKMLIYTK